MTAVLFGSLRAEIVDSPGHHTGLAGRAASCPPWTVRPAPGSTACQPAPQAQQTITVVK